MERVKAGYVIWVNPFNANQQKRISLVPKNFNQTPSLKVPGSFTLSGSLEVPGSFTLSPSMKVPAGKGAEDGVDAFVFWTRNPRNILANAGELTERGFNFYVMVTVTGYPNELEPSMIKTSKVLAAMKELALKIGSERVIWRYDPIFLSSITDENFHRSNFSALAQALSGSVNRVIISFYNDYQKSHERIKILQNAGIFRMIKIDDMYAGLLTDMAKSAEAAGMEIQSCASEKDFSPYGIKPGACIDKSLINKLWGIELKNKDKNQRPHCLCCQSIDIGAYNMCSANCIYCYAW